MIIKITAGIIIVLTAILYTMTYLVKYESQNHPHCYPLANLTSNQIYISVGSTTAVWYTENDTVNVLPLCEGYYTQDSL